MVLFVNCFSQPDLSNTWTTNLLSSTREKKSVSPAASLLAVQNSCTPPLLESMCCTGHRHPSLFSRIIRFRSTCGTYFETNASRIFYDERKWVQGIAIPVRVQAV